VEPLEFWPNGDIEFGQATIDGELILMIQFTDDETGRLIRAGFRKAAFVTFADHVAMLSDRIVGGEFD